MNKIVESIANIINDIADIPLEEIGPDSAFIDDLDLASIEIMSVVAEVERLFSVKISEKELLSIRTINELAEVVKKNKDY